MKLTGKINRTIKNGTRTLIELDVPTYQCEGIDQLTTEELVVSLSKKKETKTSQQRKYAWVLITEIDKAMNGFNANLDETYIEMLKTAKVNPVYLECLPSVLDELTKVFRVVELIEPRQSQRGVETALYRCYKGISLLNKEEMIELIEVIKMYASQYGVEIERSYFE